MLVRNVPEPLLSGGKSRRAACAQLADLDGTVHFICQPSQCDPNDNLLPPGTSLWISLVQRSLGGA
jgi:hypothetical protein